MLFCLLFALQPAPQEPPAIAPRYYRGELFRKAADGMSPVDDFELVEFTDRDGKVVGHVLSQSGHDRGPWTDSIGDTESPQLWHNHDGVIYKLEPVKVKPGSNLTEGASWQEGRRQYRAGELTEFQTKPAREVFVQEGAARNHRLLVDPKTGVTLSLQQRVFMGRGDEFRMTLNRKNALAEEMKADARFFTKLLEVRTVSRLAANSGANAVQATASALPALRKLATSRWARLFVTRIEAETKSSATQNRKLADLAKAAIGKPLPAFAAPKIMGGKLDSKQFTNHIVVLHVWHYRDEALAEPYGQTAYLDFLADGYKGKPVWFVGLNVDSRYADKTQARKADRTARKLIEFMNLSYDIIGDGGSLLKKMGDPRSAGAKLPLWIVTDKSGRVVVWKTGFYNIDARSGLKELKAKIDEQLKE